MKKLTRLRLVESRTSGRRKVYRVADPQALVQFLLRYRPPRDLIEDFLDLWENIQL